MDAGERSLANQAITTDRRRMDESLHLAHEVIYPHCVVVPQFNNDELVPNLQLAKKKG